MGYGSFSEKDINVYNSGGQGQGHDGFGFGGGLTGLILGLLLSNRNLLGGGYGAGAGAVGATELGLFNASAIDNVKTAVSNATGVIVNSNDKNTSSLASAIAEGFANNNLSRAEQTANLTNQFTNTNTLVGAGISRIENGLQAQTSAISIGFSNQQKNFSDLALQNCQDQNATLNAINCSTNSINSNISNLGQALTGQNAQLFNAIKDLGCSVNTQFVQTNCNIDKSRDMILARIDKAECDAAIAARDARIRELESKEEARSKNDIIANINVNNNNLQQQVTMLANMVNNLSMRGSGNSGNPTTTTR